MSNYNPYTASISAIATELTSDRAKQYYAIRAQQDTQMVIDATLTAGIAVYEAAVLAYQMGAFVRAWMEATEQAAQGAVVVECTVEPEVQIGDDEFWVAVESAVATLEAIENTITVEPVVTYSLPAAVPVATAPAALWNEQFVLNALVPSVAALSLIKSIEKPDKTLIALAPAKTKTATPAPRKSPTRATVGTLTLSID